MTSTTTLLVSCGVDLVDLGTFERAVNVTGGELVEVCFTNRERMQSGDHLEKLAARFAAKEAAAKAMGVGMMRGIAWQDIELLREGAQPGLALSGGAAEAIEQQGWYSWSVSLSHEANAAIAMVVALRHQELRREENEESHTGHD